MIKHLVQSGAKRFPLILGASARVSYVAMQEAYEAHAARAEMAPRVIRVSEAESTEGARRATLDLLDADPDLDGLLVPVDAFATGGPVAGLVEIGRLA